MKFLFAGLLLISSISAFAVDSYQCKVQVGEIEIKDIEVNSVSTKTVQLPTSSKPSCEHVITSSLVRPSESLKGVNAVLSFDDNLSYQDGTLRGFEFEVVTKLTCDIPGYGGLQPRKSYLVIARTVVKAGVDYFNLSGFSNVGRYDVECFKK